MCYKKHPYRWPTIGLEPSHISDSTLADVSSFYKKYYSPDNAILVIAGNIEAEKGKELAEKYFGNIKPSGIQKRELPKEEKQTAPRKIIQEQNIPLDAIYIAFHIPARMDDGYYAADILSDLLGSGKSARLNKGLRKKKHLFMEIDAYVTGSFDPGLLIIEGKVAENVNIEEAEKEIWNILEEIKQNPITENELNKLKNKALSALIFNENNLLNRSMSLAFYECLGDANYINQETIKYQALNAEILFSAAKEVFAKENSNTLIYKRKEV
ncbi:MAG: M16 family metallopeptidase [Saprospiraceae bacterium]